MPPAKRRQLCSLVIAFVAGAALLACAPSVDTPSAARGRDAVGGGGILPYQKASFAALPGWTADDHAAALATFLRSCPKLEAPGSKPLRAEGGMLATAADWRAACAKARQVAGGDRNAARAFFERQFTPLAIAAGAGGEGLFTGYFEPQLSGATRPDSRYRVPLYRPPPDLAAALAQGRPHYDRSAIDAGALAGQDLELLWVDDPIDAFFLHIQGSGRVALADGRVIRVGFAGKNGHPYFAIGRELIARGALAKEDVTMQSIREWLQDNPHEAQDVMALNPSYVYFRIVDGPAADGPIGAMGVPLTSERSLAVDPAFVPYGAPVWIETVDPLTPARPLRRLLIAQDTGTAIKGAGRGDVFWGHGPEAAARAGAMRSPGRSWLLVPNPATTT